MKTFEIQITCVKQFTIDAPDADEAERIAYLRFDAAPFGNFDTDYILEVGDDSKDE